MGHDAIPVEGRLVAALFFAGAGAALSHATAAWWWQLVDDEPGHRPELALARSELEERFLALCEAGGMQQPGKVLADLARALAECQDSRHTAYPRPP